MAESKPADLCALVEELADAPPLQGSARACARRVKTRESSSSDAPPIVPPPTHHPHRARAARTPMGSWIVFELARAAVPRAARAAAALHASANRSSHLAGRDHDPDRVAPELHAPPRAAGLLGALERRYGRNPDLATPAIRDFIEPLLRADFGIFRRRTGTWRRARRRATTRGCRAPSPRASRTATPRCGASSLNRGAFSRRRATGASACAGSPSVGWTPALTGDPATKPAGTSPGRRQPCGGWPLISRLRSAIDRTNKQRPPLL